MAPFRSSARSSRNNQGRAAIDHDVFEGLPIRQWRYAPTTITPPAPPRVPSKDELPELPLPNDFHLLPEYSQRILRAARSGRHRNPPAQPNEEEKENEEEETVKEVERGFVAKKWSILPRHAEEPEKEYLAKRRKGLPSIHQIGIAATQALPTRKTKVKKTDAEGNVRIYEVQVPEGQAVEGEIVAETVEVTPAAVAPGTVIEGIGIANAEGVIVASELAGAVPTPPRRRVPPPRKKQKKGPGRGKKKVQFTDTSTGENASTAEGTAATAETASNAEVAAGSGERAEQKTPTADVDTPMADAQDEESEGEDGDDNDDDDDREEGELSDEEPTPVKAPLSISTTAPSPLNTEAPAIPSPDKLAPPQGNKRARDPSSSPELPLASHSRQGSLQQTPTLPSGITPLPPPASEASAAEAKPDTEMEDGEVDIFVSLEAHLDSESKGK